MGDVAELKAYMVDTNAIRYKTNSKGQPEHKKAARRFWREVLEEVRENKAFLLVPNEVVRELEVQSFTLGEKENQQIAEL